jgi:hypothetical protein
MSGGGGKSAAMTVEAIRADKWAAVDLPVPEAIGDDLLLLNQASFAAMDCFEQREPPDGVSPSLWEERRAAAGERVKELGGVADGLLDSRDWPKETRKDLLGYVDKADLVRAWQAPEFNEFTIAADPYTSVYLPIPADSSEWLLEHALSWARDLEEYARTGMSSRPFVTLPKDALEAEPAAVARIKELEGRLELTERTGLGESARAYEVWDACAATEKDLYLRMVLDVSERSSGAGGVEGPQQEQRRGRRL